MHMAKERISDIEDISVEISKTKKPQKWTLLKNNILFKDYNATTKDIRYTKCEY